MIKNTLIIAAFILFNYKTYSQTNLVPNGSFEDTVNCPNSTCELNYTTYWVNGGSCPEYYNACSPQGDMSVPSNIAGYQYAADGVAYIGCDVYDKHNYFPGCQTNCQIRDVAATYFITPMVVGQKYYLSFKTVLTIDTAQMQEGGFAVNKIGFLFSKHMYTAGCCASPDPIPVNNQAQFYTNQVITDTTHWTTVSGTYVADSAYTIIYVGNFFDSTQVTLIDYYHNYPKTCGAYYFIDDIRVSTDSAYGLGVEIKQEVKKTFSVYPNPSTGTLNIKPPDNDTYIMEMYDMLGNKLISDITLSEGGEAIQLDVSYLSNGTYFITLRNTNTVLSNKVIINK